MFAFAKSLKRQEMKLMSPKANLSQVSFHVYKHRSLTTALYMYGRLLKIQTFSQRA
uniref:Uncharacterized protein n=1 Tax=Anguilla anguilla TaxID=7936 RepID=A0A0E9PKA8_ANGAN